MAAIHLVLLAGAAARSQAGHVMTRYADPSCAPDSSEVWGTLYEPEVLHGEDCWTMHINTSTLEEELFLHYACGRHWVVETVYRRKGCVGTPSRQVQLSAENLMNMLEGRCARYEMTTWGVQL